MATERNAKLPPLADVVKEKWGEATNAFMASISYAKANDSGNVFISGDVSIGGSVIIDGTGKTGADTRTGGTGDDTYLVDNVGDVVTEKAGEGTDTVYSAITYVLPENVEKLVLTGSGSHDGTGNSLDNVINGNSGGNFLDGGAGADTMAGGAGDDTYRVNDKGDVVIELPGEGYDTVVADITYVLPENVESLALFGSGDLAGTGNALNNLISGNAGNNRLDGCAGRDMMIGAGGDDTYYVDNFDDIVMEQAGEGTDTIVTGVYYALWAMPSNVENLTLTGTLDLFGNGNSLDNVITGNAGNNELYGGLGDDTLIGGAGADVALFPGTSTGYRLSYSNGTITVQDIDATNGNYGTDTLTQIETMHFANRDIHLVDGLKYIASYPDLIAAFGANADAGVTHYLQYGANEGRTATFDGLKYIASYVDLINAFGTNADAGITHYLQLGSKEGRVASFDANFYLAKYSDLRAAFGTDTTAAEMHYIVNGSHEGRPKAVWGNDTLTGSSSDDALNGYGGNDTIYGGAGNDTFDWDPSARAGNDVFYGGRGDDTYVLDSFLDRVVEYDGEGTDTIWVSFNFSLALLPYVENLMAFGTQSVVLTGNAGSNSLLGSSGNDTLYGLGGNDKLTGGSGADTFVFAANQGADVITDFSISQGDRIRIAIGTNGITTTAEALAHVYADAGGNTVVDLGNGNSVTLMGVLVSSLHSTDFELW